LLQERLNGLTPMAVYKNISILAEEVLNELAKKKKKVRFVDLIIIYYVNIFYIILFRIAFYNKEVLTSWSIEVDNFP
jgi:hypothetical protein